MPGPLGRGAGAPRTAAVRRCLQRKRRTPRLLSELPGLAGSGYAIVRGLARESLHGELAPTSVHPYAHNEYAKECDEHEDIVDPEKCHAVIHS